MDKQEISEVVVVVISIIHGGLGDRVHSIDEAGFILDAGAATILY